MTPGPASRKCTAYLLAGPGGMPLGLGLNEGLGVSAASLYVDCISMASLGEANWIVEFDVPGFPMGCQPIPYRVFGHDCLLRYGFNGWSRNACYCQKRPLVHWQLHIALQRPFRRLT